MDECYKAYELIVNYTSRLFSKIFFLIVLDFNINKLVIYSDTLGSLISLDIIKNAIKNNIKIPDSAVFVYPYPKIVLEELQSLKDPFSILGIDDSHIEIPLDLKIQEMFLDCDIEQEKNLDDRLNFFLSDPNTVSMFPKSLIVSSSNDPIRENSIKLFEFLQYIKFNNGFLEKII